jgi:hypothetical protein
VKFCVLYSLDARCSHTKVRSQASPNTLPSIVAYHRSDHHIFFHIHSNTSIILPPLLLLLFNHRDKQQASDIIAREPFDEDQCSFRYVAMSSQSGNAWAQMKANEQKQQQQAANTNFDKGKQASSICISSRGCPRMFFPEEDLVLICLFCCSRSAADYQLRQR